jgi:heme-degrading monooxygenase HmoA
LTGQGSLRDHGCNHLGMVLEHALLSVKPGQDDDFVAAFAQAKTIIAAVPGFVRLTLSKCLQRVSTYLLLVEWSRLEDHTVGFRESAEYEQWRQMLHHFYEPFPTVEHYEQILSA